MKDKGPNGFGDGDRYGNGFGKGCGYGSRYGSDSGRGTGYGFGGEHTGDGRDMNTHLDGDDIHGGTIRPLSDEAIFQSAYVAELPAIIAVIAAPRIWSLKRC